MERQFLRIPLTMDALFSTDGTVTPLKFYYKGRAYDIMRILGRKKHCPPGVRAIAPLEYSVLIDGRERKIYYEEDSNTWFSVKEVYRG